MSNKTLDCSHLTVREKWPPGENTITCAPHSSINKMESVMDDQAEIFQIRQKLDRLTFLTNFLA